MRDVGISPIEVEELSVDATIPTIRFFQDFGECNSHDAPKPPHNVIGVGNKTGSANETQEDPSVALTRQRWTRMRAIALRLKFDRDRKKRCRNKLHEMTEANTIKGSDGCDRCRECRNLSRRVAA